MGHGIRGIFAGFALARPARAAGCFAAAAVAAGSAGSLTTSVRAGSDAFQPPADSAIPAGEMGDDIRLGQAIFHDPGTHAAAFVGNALRCSNCHLDDGRRAGSSPMWAAWVSYPAFRRKTGRVDTFEERLRGCFRYSMNGREPPPGDPVLVALQAYAFFLARGLPTGEAPQGRGYPEVPKPALAPDYIRGKAIFGEKCASCHGADGAGRISDGVVAVPPLWGARSFNWGAGMAMTKNAAGFIQASMPYGQGGTLSAQDAWDLATYVDSQVRPQDPRFTGDVATTRRTFHDTPFSLYGTTVDGRLLGDPRTTPPFGTVPEGSAGEGPARTDAAISTAPRTGHAKDSALDDTSSGNATPEAPLSGSPVPR